MTGIDVDGLEKSYGAVHAVDGMAFAVERGDLFDFLGSNGADKTTTIRALTGQIRLGGETVRVPETDPATESIETRGGSESCRNGARRRAF